MTVTHPPFDNWGLGEEISICYFSFHLNSIRLQSNKTLYNKIRKLICFIGCNCLCFFIFLKKRMYESHQNLVRS